MIVYSSLDRFWQLTLVGDLFVLHILAGVFVLTALSSVFLPQSMGMAHFVWISPLQCILSVGLVWELIDVNGFCALAAISLLGIIQAGLSHKMGPYK